MRNKLYPVLAAAAILALFVFAGRLDDLMNRSGIDSDSYKGSVETSYAKGSLDLYGSVYDYYHSFDNYLFMGTDHSGNEDAVGDDHQNSMADFLLLMSIDRSDDSYSLLQLDRNTITTVSLIDDKGQGMATAEQQLCTAHWYGGTDEIGCQNQVIAVSDLLGGLPISGYFSLGLDDIPELNHAIGGVTVTMRQDLTNIDPAFRKNAQVTLTDRQAQEYLQARMNAGNGTNAERMQRQTDYLNAFLDQGPAKVQDNMQYYYDIMSDIEQLSVTDMTGKQFSRVARAMTENTFRGLVSFRGETKLGTVLGDGIEHEEFYPDSHSVTDTLSAIFSLKIRQETEYADPSGETETEKADTWEEWAAEHGEETEEYTETPGPEPETES